MRCVRSQRRSPTEGYRAADSATDRARRMLAEHRPVVARFQKTRRDLKEFTAFAEEPGYGKLMSVLRRAAVELDANPGAELPKAILSEAALQLSVPLVDLKALVRVPAHLVATGAWRPRSVNVDLVEPDDSTKLGPDTAFQKNLNKLSSKLPDVGEWRPTGLRPLYMAASKVVPVVDAAGKAVSVPLFEAAEVVRDWSDALADDVQKRLRDIRDATSSSGLKMSDLKELHPLEQKMAIMTGRALSGLALEAETFIEWARDPKSLERPEGALAKLRRWSSAGLDGLARFCKAVASGVDVATDADSWKTLAVHLQVGGGLEKWWVSSRIGVSLMFPTLEQVERDGEAVVKVVSRVNPVDTLFGGMTLTSRGGGVNFRAGPVGAKISEFEHEVKGGIPGIIGLAVGEDYAYGPVVAFGYSPPVGLLNVLPLPVNIRAGGEIKIFHPAFAGLSKPTRRMAEEISIGCDNAHHAMKKAGAAVTGKPVEGSQDGWPTRQRWSLAQRLVGRAEVSKSIAKERLRVLADIEPSQLAAQAGEAASMLGDDAARPEETHATIASYLKYLTKKIDHDAKALRTLAKAASQGERVDKKRVKALTASLRRSTVAFEYVDNLLYAILVEPQVQRQIEDRERSAKRPPHRDHGRTRADEENAS